MMVSPLAHVCFYSHGKQIILLNWIHFAVFTDGSGDFNTASRFDGTAEGSGDETESISTSFNRYEVFFEKQINSNKFQLYS